MFNLILFVQELANQMQTLAGAVRKGQYETILSPVESIGVLFARSVSSSASGVCKNSGARHGTKVLRLWHQSRKMGEFRDHTIQEKWKLHNARQKQKRKQRSAERKASEAVKLQQSNEDRLKEVMKLWTIARVYSRKWQEKCVENQQLQDSLQKSNHRTLESNAFHITACSLSKGQWKIIWHYLLFIISIPINRSFAEARGRGQKG